MKRILTNGLAFLGAALLIAQLSSCSSDNAVVDSSLGENVPVKNVTAAPTNLAASEIEEHSFRVTWDGGDATNFIVETSTVADFSVKDSIVVSDPISETKYYVRNVIEEKDYYVRIKATTFGEEESEYSEILNVTTLAPYRPTLGVPTNFTVINVKGFEVSLSWSAGEAERWIVQYGTDSTLEMCEETDQLTEPNVTINPLVALTDYYFRVKALAKGWHDSEYTKIIHAKTADLAPAPLPTNLAISEIDTCSMKLTWDANGATSWMVCFSVNQDFSDPYRLSDEITTNEFLATGLNINTKYYFRVRAYKENYKVSEWTTEGNPSATTLAADVNVDSLRISSKEVTKSSFILSWTSSYADYHALEISKDAAFGTLEAVSIDSVSAKSGSSVVIDSLPVDGAKYYVRLKAIKEGYNSVYSPVHEVTLVDPNAIELTAPANLAIGNGVLGATANTMTVTWDANTQTTDVTYEIRIDSTVVMIPDSIPARATASTPSWKVWGEPVTATSYTAENVMPNMAYFAQVRAIKEGCVASPWATAYYTMPTGGRAFPSLTDDISLIIKNMGETDVLYLTVDHAVGSYQQKTSQEINHSFAIESAPGVRAGIKITGTLRWALHADINKISYKGLYMNHHLGHAAPTAATLPVDAFFHIGKLQIEDCHFDGNNSTVGPFLFRCWGDNDGVKDTNNGAIDSIVVNNIVAYNHANTQSPMIWGGNGNGKSRSMAKYVSITNSTFTTSRRGVFLFNHCEGDTEVNIENCTFAGHNTDANNAGGLIASVASQTSKHAFNVNFNIKNTIYVSGHVNGKSAGFMYLHKNYTGAAQATCSKLFYVDAAGKEPTMNKITVTGLEPTVAGKPEAIFKKPNAANPFATVDSYKIIHADIPATVGDQRWNK